MLGDGTTVRSSDAEEAKAAESYWGQCALTNAFCAFEHVIPWHALGAEHTTDLPQRVRPTSVYYRNIAARRDFAATMGVAPGLRERLAAQRAAAAGGHSAAGASGGSESNGEGPPQADATAVAPATPAALSSGYLAGQEQRTGLRAPPMTAQLIVVDGKDGVEAKGPD